MLRRFVRILVILPIFNRLHGIFCNVLRLCIKMMESFMKALWLSIIGCKTGGEN